MISRPLPLPQIESYLLTMFGILLRRRREP